MTVDAEVWLKRLLKELRKRGFGRALRNVNIFWSYVCDMRNKKDPRAFCHVVLGNPKIRCARALDLLPDVAIAGILLHELAHMIVEHKPGDPELNVDDFVLEVIPDAGYHYGECEYVDGRRRKAKNIEMVSKKFLEKIS